MSQTAKQRKYWQIKTTVQDRSTKSWLQGNNEGKSALAKNLIRTVKESYKYMTSVLKNMNVDKLTDTFNKYNNTYHRKKNCLVKTKKNLGQKKQLREKLINYMLRL